MVQVVTFGCRINSFESEILKEKFKDRDNLIIVNTCAVTGEAERQCRQCVRKLRHENKTATLVVTGCSAEVNALKYANMPEVDYVVGNAKKTELEKFLADKDAPRVCAGDIQNASGLDCYPITGFEGRQKAFVQIQQGCDHRCTYCIVPYARGKSRSQTPENVLKQIELLISQGFEHICLTGIDLCSYKPSLSELVRQILQKFKQLKVLSFGSLDPAAVDDELIELIGQYKNILPYFHLSVQSGDDMVLKRMGRRHLRKDVIALCQKIRKVRPDATFGADFICGFPTETPEAFENTCRLVEEAGIDKLHVFPYSERAGTPAVKMPQVKMEERRARAKKLRSLREEKDD